ncbi:MAG: hypothetical protein PF484_06195 [Bacteroidales bacterium]|jgi:hypothetical protein|nr:hypothetical protein [Bacteroidales bacterium]
MERQCYQMHKLSKCDNSSVQELDYLFIAAGTAKRAYKVLDELEGIAIKNVVVIDFFERREGDKQYLQRYYSYNQRNFNFIKLDAYISNPTKLLKSIVEFGVKIASHENVGIDITSFSRPYIFSLLKYLQKAVGISSVNVFYSEPKSYVFKDGYCKTYKSSSGPIRIIELPSYTGHNINENERLLIVLLGFDGDLSKEISFEVSPKKTFLINGFPGYSPKFKDISLINNEILTSKLNNEVAYCRANNPFDTYNKLDELYNKQERSLFFNLAPIGPKPMVLGACLFALHNPSVRVVYPQPEKYLNEETSIDIWRSWHYKLPIKNEK